MLSVCICKSWTMSFCFFLRKNSQKVCVGDVTEGVTQVLGKKNFGDRERKEVVTSCLLFSLYNCVVVAVICLRICVKFIGRHKRCKNQRRICTIKYLLEISEIIKLHLCCVAKCLPLDRGSRRSSFAFMVLAEWLKYEPSGSEDRSSFFSHDFGHLVQQSGIS